jgi:hypothetical protein
MNVNCGLNALYGQALERVSLGDQPAGEAVFSPGDLPSPPPSLATSRIVIEKKHHDYNSWYRADLLDIHLSRRTARLLGLHILACELHRAGEVEIQLTHPASDIRSFVCPGISDPPFGLILVPAFYRYMFEPESRYPWTHQNRDPHDLPLLALTDREDLITTDAQWEARDSVRLESSTKGNALLAELLLNAGSPLTSESEFCLEGDAGCRGVAPMSAEARFILPGAFLWEHEDLNERV